MARCPYGPHRLTVTDHGFCKRCNADVRLYAAVRWLPELLFNDAQQLVEGGNLDAAEALLSRAISLRSGFAEAHWLIAAIYLRRGLWAEAAQSLATAKSLGANVDLEWTTGARPTSENGDERGEDAVSQTALLQPESATAESSAQQPITDYDFAPFPD